MNQLNFWHVDIDPGKARNAYSQSSFEILK